MAYVGPVHLHPGRLAFLARQSGSQAGTCQSRLGRPTASSGIPQPRPPPLSSEAFQAGTPKAGSRSPQARSPQAGIGEAAPSLDQSATSAVASPAPAVSISIPSPRSAYQLERLRSILHWILSREVQRQDHMAIVPWYHRQDKKTRLEKTTIDK
jgi:hypothetical protein